jgi:hypothetical protein
VCYNRGRRSIFIVEKRESFLNYSWTQTDLLALVAWLPHIGKLIPHHPVVKTGGEPVIKAVN